MCGRLYVGLCNEAYKGHSVKLTIEERSQCEFKYVSLYIIQVKSDYNNGIFYYQ